MLYVTKMKRVVARNNRTLPMFLSPLGVKLLPELSIGNFQRNLSRRSVEEGRVHCIYWVDTPVDQGLIGGSQTQERHRIECHQRFGQARSGTPDLR